jgi:hypothetical protein
MDLCYLKVNSTETENETITFGSLVVNKGRYPAGVGDNYL